MSPFVMGVPIPADDILNTYCILCDALLSAHHVISSQMVGAEYQALRQPTTWVSRCLVQIEFECPISRREG